MAADDNTNSLQWLGLLKWSLAYSDGTKPSSETKPMKKEDVEFLERVMREGIVDEGERMKGILADLTASLEATLGGGGGAPGEEEEKLKELGEDEMLDLLQELRDIVEQIDYARAFMALGGIPFLLGCATHDAADGRPTVPPCLRKGALGVLSTMCQNNPPIQLSLLEHGHLPQLLQLFLDHTPGDNSGGDDGVREKAMQALSASVRGHAMAEHIFCQNERGKAALQLGLGMQRGAAAPRPPAPLRTRALFFLRALLLSDDATAARYDQFQDVVSFICTHGVDEEWEAEGNLREMGLDMLARLLRREGAADAVIRHRDRLGATGVARVAAIRRMVEGSEEREFAALELEAWEALLVALAETERGSGSNEPLALLR